MPQNLKSARQGANLTQIDLAKMLGVNRVTIRRWENDISSIPLNMAVRIADILNVSTDYLMGRADSATGTKKAPGAQTEQPGAEYIPNDVAVEPMPSGKKIKVPLLSEEVTACCGGGIPPLSVTNDASILYEYTVSELGGAFDEIRPPFALKADGACLERSGIHDGYVLIVNPAIEPRQGDICIVFWNDLLSAKRVFRSVKNGVEKIQLRSDYESFDVPEEDIESGRFAIWGPVIEFRGRPRRGL